MQILFLALYIILTGLCDIIMRSFVVKQWTTASPWSAGGAIDFSPQRFVCCQLLKGEQRFCYCPDKDDDELIDSTFSSSFGSQASFAQFQKTKIRHPFHLCH